MGECTGFRARRQLTLAIALALGLGSANAANIVVHDGGDSGTASTCTLRQALESANGDSAVGSSCIAGSDADSIEFDSGLAGATIALAGTRLLVNSTLTLNGSGQVIDAGGLSQVLVVVGDADLQASHVTLTNGYDEGDGGAIFVNNSDVSMYDAVISNSTAGGNGGGLQFSTFFNDNSLNLSNVTVIGNAGYHGAGLNVETTNQGEATIDLDNVVLANNAAESLGGGLRISTETGSTTVTLHEAAIHDNSARLAGGGVHAYGSGTRVTMTDSIVTSNSVFIGGAGGLGVGDYALATVTDSIIANNDADTGGGIAVHGFSNVSLERVRVIGNDASILFGKYGGTGGGVFATSGSGMTLTATTISGNTAVHGAALAVAGNDYFIKSTKDYDDSNGAYVRVAESIISGNSTDVTGAVYVVYGGMLELVNSTITDNSSASGSAGVSLRALGDAVFDQATITENKGTDTFARTGGLFMEPGCTVTMRNSILAGNTVLGSPDDAFVRPGASLLVQSSLLGAALQSGHAGNGNIFSNAPGLGPLGDNGGPTLTMAPQPGSPALDAADNAGIPTDVITDQRGSGYPRILGGMVDMGAVEGVGDIIFLDGFEP